MTLVIETQKYRNKVDKDFIILVLQIDVEDEDYREPAYIYKTDDLYAGWQVSLNHKFLEDWEEIQDE